MATDPERPLIPPGQEDLRLARLRELRSGTGSRLDKLRALVSTPSRPRPTIAQPSPPALPLPVAQAPEPAPVGESPVERLRRTATVATSAFGSALRGALEIGGAMLQGPGELLAPLPGGPEEPGDILHRAGTALRGAAATIEPDPRVAGTFLGETLPRGAGSLVPFLAAQAAGGLPATLAFGVSSGAGLTGSEAREAGGPAGKAAVLGGIVGSTEAIPISRAFQRLVRILPKGSANKLVQIGRSALAGSLEEGAQEAASEILYNHIGQLSDPDRELWQGVLESGAVGAILGAAMSGGAATLPGKLRGPTRQVPVEEAGAPADVPVTLLETHPDFEEAPPAEVVPPDELAEEEVGVEEPGPPAEFEEYEEAAELPIPPPPGPAELPPGLIGPSDAAEHLRGRMDELAAEQGPVRLSEEDKAALRRMRVTPPAEEAAVPEEAVAEGPAVQRQTVPIAEIDIEPERFQFKRQKFGALADVDVYDPDIAGPVDVWIDPADGRMKVVNGHNRLRRATELGETEHEVRVIQAETAAEARLFGAVKNIAEGHGEPADAAKVFREEGFDEDDFRALGLGMRNDVARLGRDLANLPDDLFRRVATGEIRERRGAAIGATGLSEANMRALNELIARRERGGRPVADETIRELARFAEGAGETEVSQETLFGTETEAQSNALEKAELSAYVRGQIVSDKRLMGYVTRAGRAERLAEAGAGEIDVERAGEVAQQAATAEEVYDKLAVMTGPIADALNEGARRLAAGENPNDVRRETYDRIAEAIESGEATGIRTGRTAPQEPTEAEPAEEEGAPRAEEVGPEVQEDIFGAAAPAEGGEQFGLGIREPAGPEGISLAEARARRTVDRLRPLVDGEAATPEQRQEYADALAVLGREGPVTEAEIRATAEGAADTETGDLFAEPIGAPGELIDEVTARRVGMPAELRADLNLLAEDRAWRRAVITEGARVRHDKLGFEGEVVRPAERGQADDPVLVRHPFTEEEAQRLYDEPGRITERFYPAIELSPAERPRLRGTLGRAVAEGTITEERARFLQERSEAEDAFQAAQADLQRERAEPDLPPAERPRLRGPERPEPMEQPLSQEDLFGRPAPPEGGEQFALEIEEGVAPEGVTMSERRARNTVDRLRPLVERGAATPEQRAEYREALALLRREERVSPEEIALEAEGELDRISRDLFETELLADRADPLDPWAAPKPAAAVQAPPPALAAPPTPGAPVSAPQVIAAYQRILEEAGKPAPMRVGHLGRRQVEGLFKPHEHVMRLRRANNIPTAAHEVAHAFEAAVFGYPKGGPWKKPLVAGKMQKELAALGRALYGQRKPSGGYKREGFAEYVRLWMEDPATAQREAPTFHAWFDGTFLAGLPESVQDAFRDARRLTDRHRTQGSVKRGLAGLAKPPTLRERVAKSDIRDWIWTRFFEAAQPLHDIAERAGDLSYSDDPFLTTSALRYTHHARARYMVERGMIDLAGNRVGPSLEDARALVEASAVPDAYSDFDRHELWAIYLWARRSRALLTDPRGPRDPGMTLEDAEQTIGELGTPQFEQAAEIVYGWADGVLDYMAEASPVLRQMATAIRERDPGDYVPLRREFSELERVWRGSSGGRTNKIRRLKGSGRRVHNPVESLIARTPGLILQAHEQMVMDQVVRLAQLPDMGELIEEVPVDETLALKQSLERVFPQIVEALGRGVSRQLRTAAGDPKQLAQARQTAAVVSQAVQTLGDEIEVSSLGEELAAFFAPKRHPDSGEPIVTYWDGSQFRWYYVQPDIYRALEALDRYYAPKVLDVMFGMPRRVFRAGTTGIRASWGLIWNPIKDAQTYGVNSRLYRRPDLLLFNYFRSVKEAALALAPVTRDRQEWMDYFAAVGGPMAMPLGEDIPQTRRAARRVTGTRRGRYRAAAQRGSIAGMTVETVESARDFYDLYRDVVQFPEAAPRLAELRNVAHEIGWEPGQPATLEQSLQLLLAAKQVTTDFTAAGTWGRVINQFTPFFNAAIQGPRALGRAAGRNPRAVAARVGLLGVLSMLLYWTHKDEDWYQELTYRERWGHWWIPVRLPGGKETLVRIPRGFEVGSASALPEMALSAWYERAPEQASAWMEHAFTQLSPVSPKPWEAVMEATVPTTVVGEQLANEVFFFDSPIVPMREQRLPAEEQYGPYTSRVAVWLGEKLNLSPRRIEHALQGFFGGIVRDVQPLTDALVEQAGLAPEGAEREREASDIPVIGRLFRPGGRIGGHPRSVDQLYDLLEKAQKRQASGRVEETRDERERRLLLADAAQAISALAYVEIYTREADRRAEINATQAKIARDAVRDYEKGTTFEVDPETGARRRLRGPYTQLRRRYQGDRDRLERVREPR